MKLDGSRVGRLAYHTHSTFQYPNTDTYFKTKQYKKLIFILMSNKIPFYIWEQSVPKIILLYTEFSRKKISMVTEGRWYFISFRILPRVAHHFKGRPHHGLHAQDVGVDSTALLLRLSVHHVPSRPTCTVDTCCPGYLPQLQSCTAFA